jgi:hypothetical protein
VSLLGQERGLVGAQVDDGLALGVPHEQPGAAAGVRVLGPCIEQR